MLFGNDLPLAVGARQQITTRICHEDIHIDPRAGEISLDRICQPIHTLAGTSRDHDRVRLATQEPRNDVRLSHIGLVDDDQLGYLIRTDLGEHLANCRNLILRCFICAINDMQYEVRIAHLFQSGSEGIHKLVR